MQVLLDEATGLWGSFAASPKALTIVPGDSQSEGECAVAATASDGGWVNGPQVRCRHAQDNSGDGPQ